MRLTEKVHLALKATIRLGETAIDATSGNGYDTLAMAGLVGPSGKVIAIDIQRSAIESTRARIEASGLLDRCQLILGDHAETLARLQREHGNTISAITFNLGYLPGGAKDLITLPDTTLRAIDCAADLLRADGILLVTAYRGHLGGPEEARGVEAWMRTRAPSNWQIETHEPPTREADRIPPVLWIARKSNCASKIRKGGPEAALK